MTQRPIRRALISVYDKSGLAELGRGLAEAGVEIVSTGSTAARLAEAGLAVVTVEELTGFPECLDGRVKTLHPNVHAGLLADLRRAEHAKQLDELGIAAFDLLVGNLYPFRETVAAGADTEEIVEQIDIGGPAMVRAAAKNHANVAVVVDPGHYADVLAAIGRGGFTFAERRALAAQAFAHVAAYDAAVATWFAERESGEHGWPAFGGVALQLAAELRYGENPHQRAALYLDPHRPAGLAQATQLHGKPMSYNNYVDADAAMRAAYDFDEPCVAIVKHTNPCGIALGTDAHDPIADAHRRAHACDPVSAFGGVIAANRQLTIGMAEQVSEVFTEVVVAPGFEPEAVRLLSAKPSLRLLVCPHPERRVGSGGAEFRQISGGWLAQTPDLIDAPGDHPDGWTLQAGEPADPDTLAELQFAWRTCRAVKSNAIVLTRGRATVGVGMGQVNRVDAARLAVARAGEERAVGAVAASDAYFPFPDGLEVLTVAGVRAIVEPGGSVRDGLVVEAAQAAGVTLYFTGVRHFFH